MANSKKSSELHTNSPDDLESRELLSRLAGEDSVAAQQVFDRYLERLLKLAASRLSGQVRRRFDEQDVVQSALKSFFIGAKSRLFSSTNSGDLWRLLATITLRKLYRKANENSAGKRDYRRETFNDSKIENDLDRLANLVAAEPTNNEADSLLDELHAYLDTQSERHRAIIQSRLSGNTLAEVAKEVGCHERTVRRVLKSVRDDLSAGSSISETPISIAATQFEWKDITLTQHIGSGGIGKVYRAKSNASGENVAVKALRKSLQKNYAAIRNLENEATIMRSLNHPRVVKFIGIGRFPNGGTFLVTQWVDGENLQQHIDARRTSKLPKKASGELALSVFIQCVEAVAYLHQQGIVHCDLKPANFLIDKQQGVWLTDFGFSKLVSSRRAATASGGTPAYMAPEQRVTNAAITPAADIYALGAIFNALLHHQQPNATENDCVGNRTSAVPPALAAIISRCLASEPSARYQDASDLLADLQVLR